MTEHRREMSCAEVLGGCERIDRGLTLPGLDAWILNVPAGGAEEGGDLVYLSVCGQGDMAVLFETYHDAAGTSSAVSIPRIRVDLSY